ncbi:MAG: CdaR family protein [Oscillospiraceae bacterium]|nr:CdaR family protein [Oscillospiraceae bacterium]
MKTALLRFAKSFLNNLKTIIFALILSVIIWLAISFQLFPNVLRTINVPISAELPTSMLDRNLELAEDFNESIEITIEGKRYEIGRLGPESFAVFLDLSEITESGEYEVDVMVVPLVNENVQVVTRDTTRQLKIIQTNVRDNLAISVDQSDIEVVDGFSIGSVTVNPSSIRIWGEKSLVDSVAEVQFAGFNSETLSATTKFTLETADIILFDDNGEPIDSSGLNIEDRVFTVTISLFKVKSLPVSVNIVNEPGNFDLNSLKRRMRIVPDELTIGIPDEASDNRESWDLDSISLSSITIWGLQNGISLPITLPEGYKNMSNDTEARIIFDDVEEYGMIPLTVPTRDFVTIGTPSGYSVSYITNSITVKVAGPSDSIHPMTIADINGTINLTGRDDLTAGTMPIRVKFTIAGSNVDSWVVEDEYEIYIEIKEVD